MINPTCIYCNNLIRINVPLKRTAEMGMLIKPTCKTCNVTFHSVLSRDPTDTFVNRFLLIRMDITIINNIYIHYDINRNYIELCERNIINRLSQTPALLYYEDALISELPNYNILNLPLNQLKQKILKLLPFL